MGRAKCGTLAGLVMILMLGNAGAGANVSAPLECTRGPSGQTFRAVVTMPAQVEQGSKLTVRVDGVSSGTISHSGLRYIHDMTSEFLIPDATTLVAGSLRIVAGTGTANVAGTAQVSKTGNIIRLTLPGQVENDSSYTPPSFEFELETKAAAGTKLAFQFSRYRVLAKALIIGDVETTCTPKPQPFTLATATVIAKP